LTDRPTLIENARIFPAMLKPRLEGGKTKRVLHRSHAYWISAGASGVVI
jgi:hypothetical protein